MDTRLTKHFIAKYKQMPSVELEHGSTISLSAPMLSDIHSLSVFTIKVFNTIFNVCYILC